MATETVEKDHPSMYDAAPVMGNFTDEASAHLWCADALASVVSNPEATFGSWNDDIQDAIRYLLAREVRRARKAQAASDLRP